MGGVGLQGVFVWKLQFSDVATEGQPRPSTRFILSLFFLLSYHSFIQLLFIKHLPYTKPGDPMVIKDEKSSPPDHGVHSLIGETTLNH